MTNDQQDVWITGIGIVSSFGEGVEANYNALNMANPKPVLECKTFSPYTIHPMPSIDWLSQIPRRSDQRQMGNWQRLGTYSAGLALKDAQIQGNSELCAKMDMIVAAGSGERDLEIDTSIMQEAMSCTDRSLLLNKRLQNDLRPTLFLAQLSNLLAGNISIVHKIKGSSRTYMGEEGAGLTAIENALARIRSGQSSHLLTGAAYNAERWDLLLPFELGHYLMRGSHDGVWSRQGKNNEGICIGCIGVFLVLENAEHARMRGILPYARLSKVGTCLGKRDTEITQKRVHQLMDNMELHTDMDPFAILSGASGAKTITNEEYNILTQRFGKNVPIRAFGTMLGHCMEGSFPLAIALAAIALKNDGFYPSFEEEWEREARLPLSSILVTAFGHMYGEGIGLGGKKLMNPASDWDCEGDAI